MLILITVGLQIQPSEEARKQGTQSLSRICNPTAQNISIYNALINNI